MHSINFHSSPVPRQCHPSKEPQTDQKKGAIIDLMSASIRAKRAERQHKAIQDREEREWNALSWYYAGKVSGNKQKFQNLSQITLNSFCFFGQFSDSVCEFLIAEIKEPHSVCSCESSAHLSVLVWPVDNEATYRFCAVQYSLKKMYSCILISNLSNLICF